MLAISVPMLLAFIAAYIVTKYGLTRIVAAHPDAPAAQGLAALL